MITQDQIVEENLIQQGKLTKSQIDDIRKMFTFIDTDKSGELSRDEVFKLVNDLSKGIYLL